VRRLQLWQGFREDRAKDVRDREVHGEARIERCNACEKLDSCGRLADFTTWDSFVSHAPCIENLHACTEMGEAGFNAAIEERRAKGEYPPAPRAKTMSAKHLWRLAKPPFHP
jgi:hypothetical protein